MFLVNAQKMHSCFYNRIQLSFLLLQLKKNNYYEKNIINISFSCFN